MGNTHRRVLPPLSVVVMVVVVVVVVMQLLLPHQGASVQGGPEVRVLLQLQQVLLQQART